MPTTNVMTNCVKCQKKTLHIEQKLSHILHLLLAIVTAGVWLIIWILLAFFHDKKTQCTVCGHNKGIINDIIVKPNKVEEDTQEDIKTGNKDLRGFFFMVLIVILVVGTYIVFV